MYNAGEIIIPARSLEAYGEKHWEETCAALEFLTEVGFRVFPCVPGAKNPMVSWTEVATRNLEQVKSWWTDRNLRDGHHWPNIGVVCGQASDLTVVDVDVKKGKRGLEKTEEKMGERWWLKHRRVITPSGGLHVWLPYQGDQVPSCKFSEGVDIQNDGTYVLACPSWLEEAGFYHMVGPREAAEAIRQMGHATGVVSISYEYVQ